MFKGDFIQNLPKIYGTYTGGFLVFIILMALADELKSLDKKIVLNSIHLKWGLMKDEFKKLTKNLKFD